MIEKLSMLANRLAKFFGDKIEFGVKSHNANIPHIENSLNYKTLASLLPYDVYDRDTELFFNKKSQGFVLEVAPLLGANEETVNILSSILTDVLPKNTDVQFILWGSDKIGETLDVFERARSGNGEIFEWLAKKRTDFLKKGPYKSLSSHGNFTLRDFRLFLSISIEKKETAEWENELITLREDIVSSLKSIQMPARNLQVEEFISVVTDLLHPSSNVYPTRSSWNPYDSLSQQVTDPEYFIRVFHDRIQFVKGDSKWEARALSVKEYPESMAQWKMTDAIGQLFNTSLQIPCQFVTSLSIRLIDHEKAILNTQINTISKEKSAKGQAAKLMPQVSKEYDDWRYVQQRLADGDRLCQIHYQIILFSEEEQAGQAERKVRDLYRSNGWRLKKTCYLQLQSLLAMLPMMMSEGMGKDMKRLGRLRTMTASNSINIAPIQAEWKGTKTPSLILPGRRGQIAGFNLFDNESGNFNAAMAGAPGKGKSVLANEIIVSSLGTGDFVAAIDNGRSYEKICKKFKGTYIEFNENTKISLNPYTYIKDFNESLPMLKPLFAAMAHPTSRASDEEIAYLEKAAKAAWDEEGNDATITTVSNWLIKHDSPICKMLSHLLYSYTKDGMYAKYFEGKSNIDLSNQFIVLELQALKSKKDLEKIVMLPLMFQISERMYTGRRDQRKTCIIDEAWDLFGGDNDGAAKFIETGFRTARKYNANFITIVQSYNDYFKNAATITCLENSDTKIILGQTADTIDQIKKERLPMDAYTERLFKSLRKTDDYSECIIKTPSGLSIHRVILDPYHRILYSSKAEEFDAVEMLQTQGHSLQDSIEIVARRFHRDI
jgi:conjugal transfer ATP-binding protein TraC